jgi:acetyltransferase EpsM
MKKRLIIVGGAGPGQIAASVFEDMNKQNDEWQIEGYLNDIVEPGDYFGKYKVLGGSAEVLDFVNKGFYIHYALHINAKAKEQRVAKIRELNLPSEILATAIHPTAYIMEGTTIGAGSLLAPYAITSFGATIGMFCHIYSNAFLGHDCIVKDYATIAAKSVVGARVIVDEGAHVGLNSCSREDIVIGQYSIVGMGAVIIKNMEPYSIYAGNPGKQIGTVKD